MYHLAQPPSQRPTVIAHPPFWRTPTGVAAIVGVTALVVGGTAWAITRRGSCAWAPADLSALGRPGRYRLDASIPASAISMSNYPATEQDWEALLQRMAGQIPAGVKVEGLWLPAVTTGNQVRGPYSFPPKTPLPSDWPAATDSAFHVRMQLLWPYTSDIAQGALSAMAKEIAKQGAILQVWQCPTGPIPQAQPLPIQWKQLAPDAQGNVVFGPNDKPFLLSTPAAGSISDTVAGLQRAGLSVEASWDTNRPIPADWPVSDKDPGRWRFVVVNVSHDTVSLNINATQGEKVFSIELPI